MSGSILVDWQVACQLGMQPKEMRSFLNAMEALRRPDRDDTMSSIRALGELARFERWVHIYVLPVACREMRRLGFAFDAVEQLRDRLVEPIIASVTGDQHRILTELVEGFIGGENPRALLNQLELAASTLADGEQDHSLTAVSDGGYLDIEEYDIVALILSIILAIAPGARSDVASAFGRRSAETATSTALGALLLRVMRGEEGRWCRLLGIDLGLAVPEIMSSQALSDSLLTASPKGLAMAPDLLKRAALLAFETTASDPQERRIVLDRIFAELVTFNHWRSLAGSLLDPESRPDDVRTSLVYWQDALWQTMVEIDANEAAVRLQRIWQPRIFVASNEIDKITVPVQPNELAATVRLYRFLGHQHGPSDRSPRFVLGPPDEASPYWWALSPWLVVDPPAVRIVRPVAVDGGQIGQEPDTPRKQGRREPRRPRGRPQILACAAAASFGARLLLRSNPNSDFSSPWRHFASHLLHALHELRPYRYVDERVENRSEKADRHLFVLAHVCRAAAEKVAGGRMSHPSPHLFVDLVADAAANGLVDGSSCFGGFIDSNREAVVVNTFLASCLRLAEYAMSAAADGGRKRWLVEVARLTSLPGYQQLDEPDGYVRRLLMRYLVKPPSPDIMIEDGLERIREAGSWTGVTNRLLLLIPTNNAAEWKLSGIPEDIPDSEGYDVLSLSRACQRAAAALQDRECQPELRQRWLQEFQLRLDAIKTEVSLDRFLRLRLIELLRGGSLAAEEDLVVVLASRLIEFGSALDLQLMGEWLAGERVDSKQQAEVRRRLFLGLIRYRRHRAEIASVTRDTGVDPDARIDAEKRRELLDRLVACCIAPAEGSQKDIAENARDSARNDRDSVLAGRLPDAGIRMPLAMDLASRLRFEGAGERQGRALVVAVDRNSERVCLLDSIGAQRPVLDLFRGDSPDPTNERSYLGVVEAHDSATGAEDNVLVRVMEQQRILVSKSAFTGGLSEVGGLVALRHGPVQTADAWRQERVREVECLPFSRDSLFLSAEVHLPISEVRKLEVRLEGRRGKLNWISQTENFLALYRGIHNESRYKIWVLERYDWRDDKSKRRPSHQPAVLDVVDLLLDYPKAAEGTRSIVMCLHELQRDAVGILEAIIIEGMPLQRYRVRLSTDLTPTARTELEQEIVLLEGERKDVAGLLITMRVVPRLDGPRLDLVRASTDLQSTPEYQVELAKPFDDSNIRWRDLFKDEDDDDDHQSDHVLLSAQLAAPGHVRVETPEQVAGFPEKIEIEIRPGQRLPAAGDGAIYTLIERDSWNPRAGHAYGEIAKTNSLELPRDRPEDVIRQLVQLKEGDIIDLARFVKFDEKHGTVVAYTRSNLRVRVAAASLSMMPVLPDQVRKSAGSIPRRARLSGRRQWDQPEIIPKVPVDALPESVRSGGIGILVSLPAISDSRALGSIAGGECEVAWLVRDAVVRGMLPIENLAEFRRPLLTQGTRVIVTVVNSRPEVRFEVPNLNAEALWEEATGVGDQDRSKFHFIGSARIRGQHSEIYEVKGGCFFAAPGNPVIGASSDLQKFTSQISGLQRHVRDVSSGANGPVFSGEMTQRSVVQYDDTGERLCGLRRRGDPAGDATLLGFDLLLQELNTEVVGPKLFTLKRRFRLQAQRQLAPSETKRDELPERPTANLEVERRRMLEVWLEKKTVLEGEHISSRNMLRVQSREARRLFRDGLSACADQVSWGSRPSLFRNRNARGVLIQSEPPVVSYTQAPALPLEELKAALDAPLGEIIKLGPDLLELYHVGIRRSEGEAGEKPQTNYNFEWGYGFWMSLPASQLHYKGDAIEAADLRLFVADQITQVRFIEDRGLLVLSIEETIPSYGHVLYRQARLHRVIHPLHVRVVKGGEPEITQIEGFDSASLDEPRQVIGRDRVGLAPQLDDVGKQIVKQRAEAAGPDQRWQGVVLGRLDTGAFTASHGTEFRFEYVRLDKSPREGVGHIRSGDRIFAIAQSVVSHGANDCALIVRPLPSLDTKDISFDFREIRILRRLFSYRQQTLLRLYGDKPDALVGRYVLMEINLGDNRPFGSLRTGSPARHEAVVDMLLAASPAGIFAIYAGSIGDEGIRLEFKPGVIVNLPRSQVDIGEDLLRGDVVRVTSPSSSSVFWAKYVVERAMYSDIRYAAERRPIVAFPMQNLAKDRPPYSHSSERRNAADSFTIGDLPDVRAHLRMLAGDKVRVPNDHELQRFMAAEHPKLAWLQQIEQGPDKNPVAVIAPDFGNAIRAGRLVTSEFSDAAQPNPELGGTVDAKEQVLQPDESPTRTFQDLKIAPLANTDPSTQNLQADWYLLTFHDQRADWIQDYVNSSSWSYHDAESIRWTSESGSSARPFKVSEATAATGPLFFETGDGKAVLRYGSENLRRYAIGFGNLIAGLAKPRVKNKRQREYAVAGVPEEGGIYVEVGPGRVVEIPPAMAHWGQFGDDTVALDLMDWQQFAPGDRLEISRMPQSDPYSPERVLLNWTPGVRNALGTTGAILPRARIDELHGAACYGWNQFEVCVPSTNPKELPELALVGGRNTLERVAPNGTPIRDDTVLLIEQDGGGIGVAGLSSWRAVPGKNWNWNADTLMQPVFRKREDGVIIVDWSKLRQRIKLAGGALPVTIERAHRPNGALPGTLYFSRRHQDPNLPIGRTMLAQIVGQLPESDWLMMRVGGRHFALSSKDLVLGLPEELRATATEQLRASNTPIWIKRLDSGYAVGVSELEREAPLVKPQLVLSDAQGDAIGIICVGARDRRLRWLPAERAAATPLTARQASAVFSNRGRAFHVWTQGDRISLIDHPRVLRELESLQVGERLGVETVSSNIDAAHRLWGEEPVPGHKLRLVRSRATGLIMAAGLIGNPGGFLAEVTERRVQEGSVFLLLVPAGQRRIKVDFPRWLADGSEAGAPRMDQEIFLADDRDLLPIGSRDIVRNFAAFLRGEEFGFELDGLIQFCASYRRADTVSLLSGIAAAVMLAAVKSDAGLDFKSSDRDRRRALSTLLRNLGYRALRSFHLEFLIRCWKDRLVPDHGSNEESAGVAPRIDALLLAIRKNAPIEVCSNSVDRLFDHIALNCGTEYDTALANALAAGLGRPADLKMLWQSCENMAETVKAVRLLMLLERVSNTECETAVAALRKVGERMLANKIDIPLGTALA